jgi:hypothetical protein
MKPHLFHILASATLVLSGFTQSVGAQEPPPQSILRILALPPRIEHPPLFLLQGEAAAIPLEIASSRLTGPYKVSPTNAWQFALTATPAQANGTISLVASCKPAPSADEQLVVLLRKPGKEITYASFVLDIKRSALNERQFLVVNLSPTEIAGDIGGARMAFPPGKPVTVSPKENLGPNLCHVDFLTGGPDGKWKPFFSTNWPLKDKIRGLVFFYAAPESEKILMHTVSDFL